MTKQYFGQNVCRNKFSVIYIPHVNIHKKKFVHPRSILKNMGKSCEIKYLEYLNILVYERCIKNLSSFERSLLRSNER